MYSYSVTSQLHGLQSIPVHVETDVSEGMPHFEMVGFLASEVKEAKDRVRTALKNSGVNIPAKKITINLTPANIRKSGNSCDLPVAASLLAAFGYVNQEILNEYVIMGEVGLNGNVLPVKGVLSAAVMALNEGYKGIIVPEENVKEAAILPEINVVPVKSLLDFIEICQCDIPKDRFAEPTEDCWVTSYDVDFSEIRGQTMLKRACEIAVAGMHNLLIIGPPGSGKTMAAKRIPTILPDLTRQEKLELSEIYSLCGMLDDKRIVKNERPFRSPHHTIPPKALTGGGNIPMPGEISLAHHGVLFLDELAEFQRSTIEVLREPMEEKKINLSRLGNGIVYPADFILVASMNPCPCGYYPDMNRCSCTSGMINNYINRVSQALLNRIDLCVETREVPFDDIKVKGNVRSSEDIRDDINRVHKLQQERFADKPYSFNARMDSDDMKKYCRLDQDSSDKVKQVYTEYNLTARTYDKLLKTARTIADLDGKDDIEWNHIQEALLFRSPDKKYWRRY